MPRGVYDRTEKHREIYRTNRSRPNKRKKGELRNCTNCQKLVYVKPVYFKTWKYCSMKCRGGYWRKVDFYKGENNPAFGKTYEKSGRGWNRGKELSTEHREAIRQSHIGEKNHFYGKKHDEETKRRIGEKSKAMYLAFTDLDWKLFKERLSKQSLEIWKRPEYIEKMLNRKQPHKDTSIEIALQKALSDNHINFTTQKAIIGRPDIFIEPNICIFADGDYWHNRPNQKEADMVVNVTLELMGMKVLRFWEHDINTRMDWCIKQIASIL